MTHCLLLASLLAILAQAAAPAEPPKADFYVAPTGNAANPGTQEQPFATLAQARDAVRKLVAAGLKTNVTVVLRAGTYELAEPAVFGPEDSGTEQFAITYAAAPGETVVLSGGRKLSGWKRGEGELWTAEVPGVREGEAREGEAPAEPKEGKWYFRQLFVNGQRAVRARTPNRDDKAPCGQLKGASLAKDLKSHTYSFAPGLLKDWKNLSDVEALVFGNWEITRKRFEKVDPATGVAHMAGPHGTPHDAMMPGPGRWFYLENAIEFLDQPGEWYLDRQTGVLTYWPLPGQDLAQAAVVAPRLTRLVEVKGTPERPVRNLHFKGIAFAHADWGPPPGGYLGIQACHYVSGTKWDSPQWGMIEAALRFESAEGCSVEDGSIAHLGGCGIELERRCHNNLIQGNDVFDVSGNGIQLGGPKDEKEVPKDNRIANNHVHDCGIDYSGAVGIWAGFTEGTVIAHNLVHALPYTGISCGWQWDPKPTPCQRNTLEFNHIYDVMNRLGDGGGIYTLGFQPGTVIRGNHIHDVHRSAFAQAAPNNGMFIDEGSKGFLFEGNVIYRTSAEPVRFNQCAHDWHTWKDNHFGIAPPVKGKIGTALACDGATTRLEVPASPTFEPERLTLEAWICPAEIPTGKDNRRWIVNKNRNEWENGHYALIILGDKVGAYLNIGGGKDNASLASSAQPLLKPNEWAHIAMTYDGATLKVYHNGALVGSAAIHKKRVPGRTPLVIGARQDDYVFFKGAVDEVRFYDRALSPDDLKAHFEKPTPAADAKPESNLVAYFGFDGLADAQDAIREATAKAGLEPPYRERLLEPPK